MNKRVGAAVAAIVLVGLWMAMQGGQRRHGHGGQPTGGAAFRVLALSWAPNYCDDESKPHSFTECGHHLGFVVHGLWPENGDGSAAAECAGGSPLGQDVARQLLAYIPDRSLIQHEWRTHGSCQFASGQQYVDAVKQAYTSLKIPDAYQHPGGDVEVGAGEIEQAFARANGVSAESFRVSCHAGKLVNLEACYTKDLKLMSCGGVRECSGQVGLDAVR